MTDIENVEHTDEEIEENIDRRMKIAIELLEDHPYVVDTWVAPLGLEFGAYFKQVNPETKLFEMMLGVDAHKTFLVNSDKRGGAEDNGIVVHRVWDVKNEYHCPAKGGKEVPFTHWSDDYEWTTGSWQRTIEEFLNDAGYEKVDEGG